MYKVEATKIREALNDKDKKMQLQDANIQQALSENHLYVREVEDQKRNLENKIERLQDELQNQINITTEQQILINKFNQEVTEGLQHQKTGFLEEINELKFQIE